MSEKSNKSTGRTVAIAVLALVAVCVTVALLASCGERKDKYHGACQDNLRTIDGSIMTYSAANNGVYPASVEEMVPNYLREAPGCSAAQKPYTLSDTTPPRAVCPHTDPHTY